MRSIRAAAVIIGLTSFGTVSATPFLLQQPRVVRRVVAAFYKL